MQFYEKNNFDALRQKFDAHLQDSSLNEKLQDLFTPKPYSLRWKYANLAAQALGYVCNLVSWITAFALLSYVLYLSFVAVLGDVLGFALASTLGAIVCAIIEILKRYSTDNFLQDAIQFKQFNKLLFAVTLLCCVASVTTSFLGAKLLPTTTTAPPIYENPILENLDSLATALDGTIAATKSELDRTRKEAIKANGELSSTGRKQIALLQSQILALETAKPIELDKARERNRIATETAKNEHNKALQAHTTGNENTGLLLGWVALALELVFLICTLFSWLYYWTSYKERCALATESQPTQTVKTQTVVAENLPPANEAPTNTTEQPNQDTKPRPIGFFDSNKGEIIVKVGNRICVHCGEQYTYGHTRQKYCTESCRVKAWERKTGKKFSKKISATN